MNSEDIVSVLILGAVIPATLGPIIYGTSGPWWRSLPGASLMVGWAGLGLFVDWAAAFVIWGVDFPLRDTIRLIVFVLIFSGLWFKLIALLIVRWRTYRGDLT